MIAFCGVHFMAETASILSPDKTVLLPDPGRRLLARGLDHRADQLRAWKAAHPGAVAVMYVNTTAEVKAETDYCVTSSNAVAVVEHIYREHGDDTEILFGPDMFLGAYVEKVTGRRMHVWDGECHVHAGIRPSDIREMRDVASRRRLPDPPRVRLLDLGDGVRRRRRRRRRRRPHALDRRHARATRRRRRRARRRSWRPRPGCSTRCAMARPDVDFVAANEAASCRFMKMITLPKLRDALREMAPVVKVPEAIAERARLPIERMVAIG